MSYINYNINPQGKQAGDCTVRAMQIALGYDWERTYIELCIEGFIRAEMPSANSVWMMYLQSKGFKKYVIPDTCPDCYTVRDFCRDYPRGTFVLATGSHVVTVIDGNYYDSWDSGNEIPIFYFVRE